MKLFVRFSALTLLFTVTGLTTSAQTRKVDDLPKSIIWNLHPKERYAFSMKDYELVVDDNDSAIYKKPEALSVNLIYRKPADFGFTDGFSVPAFVEAVRKKEGALPCPVWVPVQLFMNVDYRGEAVWIPTPRTESGHGEMVRLGINRRIQSRAFNGGMPRMDLYQDDPRISGANSVWVFMIP